MDEELDPGLLQQIELTQQTLEDLFSQPRLHAHLLARPPFRFVHDVVSAIQRETGFAPGLFAGEELHAKAIQGKDAKVSYLFKIMSVVSMQLQTPVPADPFKLVAGMEPENTNIFLQMLGKACLMGDAAEIVQAVLLLEQSSNDEALQDLERSMHSVPLPLPSPSQSPRKAAWGPLPHATVVDSSSGASTANFLAGEEAAGSAAAAAALDAPEPSGRPPSGFLHRCMSQPVVARMRAGAKAMFKRRVLVDEGPASPCSSTAEQGLAGHASADLPERHVWTDDRSSPEGGSPGPSGKRAASGRATSAQQGRGVRKGGTAAAVAQDKGKGVERTSDGMIDHRAQRGGGGRQGYEVEVAVEVGCGGFSMEQVRRFTRSTSASWVVFKKAGGAVVPLEEIGAPAVSVPAALDKLPPPPAPKPPASKVPGPGGNVRGSKAPGSKASVSNVAGSKAPGCNAPRDREAGGATPGANEPRVPASKVPWSKASGSKAAASKAPAAGKRAAGNKATRRDDTQ